MPEWNSFLVFVGAGLLLNITPGPDVLYIVGRSLGQGRLAASWLGDWLAGRYGIAAWLNRVMGGMFIAVGLRLAFDSRR